MAFANYQQFCDGVQQSGVLEGEVLAEFSKLRAKFTAARDLAQDVIRRNWLTAYQVNQIFQQQGQNLVVGPYVILERIGEGGMGQVFRARQKLLNRIVALKLIRKECLDNPRVVQRFQREIRAAGQLSHPHIVRAYDADLVDGTYYIAMEFIEGQDLAKIVKDRGPLPFDQACEYIRQAALGLQHAFERGMVHRDIKPANLLVMRAAASDRRRSSGEIPISAERVSKSSGMISRADIAAKYPWGVVKLLDLGLARCTDPFTGQAATHLTQIGSVMGTPEYIAPEQARDSHTSDVRADLYSLGCTLYFLLTGQPPFPHGTITEKLLQHQMDIPDSIAKARSERLFGWKNSVEVVVPAEVDRVVCKLLEKQPDRRFQTPLELANELRDVLKILAERPAPPLVEVLADATDEMRAIPASLPIDENLQTIVQPMPAPAARGPRVRRFHWVAPTAIATAGGLFFIAAATLLAAVLGRGMYTHASPAKNDANAKPKETTSISGWKKTLQRALADNASWDDARAELIKHRDALAPGDARKQLDNVLGQIPSPFDEMQRPKLGKFLAPVLPDEVIAVYGPRKAVAGKPVVSVVVSANSRWLAAPDDKAIRFFDLKTSPIPYRIKAHDRKVNHLAISADGMLLASASDDGVARTWDIATREPVASFGQHKKPVTHLAFHPGGVEIASAAKDRTIRLWNTRTGAETLAIDSQMDDVAALAFASDGATLFWIGPSKQVGWVNLTNRAKPTRGNVATAVGNPRTLAVQPHGDLLLVGGDFGAFQAFTWNGQSLSKLGDVHKQHQQISSITFAPNGQTFVTAGAGPGALSWDSVDLQVSSRLPFVRMPVHASTFSPEGRHLILGDANNQIAIVRLSVPDLAFVQRSAQ